MVCIWTSVDIKIWANVTKIWKCRLVHVFGWKFRVLHWGQSVFLDKVTPQTFYWKPWITVFSRYGRVNCSSQGLLMGYRVKHSRYKDQHSTCTHILLPLRSSNWHQCQTCSNSNNSNCSSRISHINSSSVNNNMVSTQYIAPNLNRFKIFRPSTSTKKERKSLTVIYSL